MAKTKKDNAVMRRFAQSANAYLIRRMIDKDPELKAYDNDVFIASAAKWMHTHYGVGRCCRMLLDAFIQEKYFSRLYSTDLKRWLKISKAVFERDSYTCQYCDTKGGRLEVDHIIPISRGGSNEMVNLATACQKCNRQKKDKTVLEFIKWRENRNG